MRQNLDFWKAKIIIFYYKSLRDMGEISEKSGSVFFKFSPPKMESPLTWAAP